MLQYPRIFKLQITGKIMKKKIFAAVLAAAMLIATVPFFAGCSFSVDYVLNEDNSSYTVTCSGYSGGLSGELEIPEFYGEGGERLPVTAVDEGGFANSGITKLVLPKTIKTVGKKAFSYCSSLKEIVFAEGGQLEEIGQEAFRGTGISQLQIPASVKTIGIAAFANCNWLQTAAWAQDSEMTVIPQSVLAQCIALESITLPQATEEIGPLAFLGCTELAAITLPQTVKVIGAKSFEGCEKFSEITFHDGITTIGELAFYQTALKEIIIPASVTDLEKPVLDENGNQKVEDGKPVTKTVPGIGYGAFHTCTSLKLAVINAQIVSIGSGTFGYCPALEKIYLPATLKSIDGAKYSSNGKLHVGHAFHNCAALTDVYFAGGAEQWNLVKVDGTTANDNGGSYNNSAIFKAEKHYNAVYSPAQ